MKLRRAPEAKEQTVQAERERRQWPGFHGFCQYLTGIPSRQGLLCQLRCPSFLGLLSFLSVSHISLETEAHAHLLLTVVDGAVRGNGCANAW